ncbi:BamA/TamA family outer membrane protein [Flammeovirgaceae bacterium SG7u.111]|nr:BamA/TamA family outer membrane protein [Flammeovirgaceae bacterium SG7u.132]WPO36387.1 BamA/TamA family outer membrane protein [Flammeovirgaceae bacterium SG7u.111]
MEFALDASEAELLKKYSYNDVFEDSASLMDELYILVEIIREDGFLLANIDSITRNNAIFRAFVTMGSQYKWVKLRRGNVPDAMLDRAGFKEKYFDGKEVSLKELNNMRKGLITYAENNGYPFASVVLDSFELDESHISASLFMTPGSQIYFDSLIVVGEVKVKREFLTSYLKMNRKSLLGKQRSPKLFNQNLIDAVEEKIILTPYLKMTAPPSVIFEHQKAFVKLYLEDEKASEIDGVVGLLPNTGNDNSLKITGQFLVSLYNPFGTGKKIYARWQHVKAASPVYELEYLHPDLLRTGVDVSFKLNSLKEDSTFNTIAWSAGLGYPLGNRAYVRFFYESLSSNVLQEEGFQVAGALLPQRTKTSINSYGVSYAYTSLDDLYFPKKGLSVDLEVQLGSKNIIPNPEFADSVYAGLIPNTTQLGAKGEMKKYFGLGKYFSVLYRNKTGGLLNEQLFLNDLYRVGGLASLRGFNENQFFTSFYSVNTLEFQAHFERQSLFFLFADQAFITTKTTEGNETDQPLGIGAGMAFSTKSGIFTLVYSIGQTKSESFNFSASKIHFGLTNRF